MTNSQEFIRFAIEKKVILFGEFTLKSGRVAPYFFNTGLFNDGQSLDRLSRFYAQAINQSGIQADMLYGPAYKGIPLVATVATALSSRHCVNLP
ncbi:MAG: orotate phosphoribosyltransferase, partial [Gammaproteobacteria bacterium]|nr:orotate phosphoribosyltransferase [Gammaproteobacteria bacterium]